MKHLETSRTNQLGEVILGSITMVETSWNAGTLSGKEAKRLSGLLKNKSDYTGYSVILYSSRVRHLANRHMNEPRKKQRNVRFVDFFKLYEIVAHCNSAFEESDGRLKFRKLYPDGEYLLIAEPMKSKKELVAVTLWILRR
ncbi:MAG: hypothetical protein IJK84_01905 [Bacteroidales bacterium]|nr:hypothetical protein [Bacteroidales bacterium]